MNKTKRFIQKDRYGIVRSCIALCVLVLLCSGWFAYSHSKNNIAILGNRAGAQVQGAAAHLEQLLDDNYKLLESAARRIDQGTADAAGILDMLSENEFLNAASIEAADGIMDGLVPCDSGKGLQMRTPLNSGEELTAVLSLDTLQQMLDQICGDGCQYTLFNAKTGICLINNHQNDTDNFYDALRQLYADGSLRVISGFEGTGLHVLRRSGDHGPAYVAILDSGSVWGLAMLIPEAMLSAGNAMLQWVGVLAGTLLLIACMVVFSSVTIRRIRNSNRNVASALDMSDRMLEISAQDARITILVFGYGRDAVYACHDGLGLTTASKPIRSIADLECACSMEDGEMDRVYDCLNELKADKTAELTVRCYTANREERSLRISFHQACGDKRNIICSICDCTGAQAEEYRVEMERSFMANARRKASSIWQINVSRNRWCPLHLSESDPLSRIFEKPDLWRDYSSDLSGKLNEYVHPLDYDDCAENMSIPGIASAFRSGSTERTWEYRICRHGEEKYEWHRLNLRIWLDTKTNDILANLYIYNVDAKKNAELERGEHKRVLQQTLMAVSGLYSGLYYVDLESDRCYTARALGGDLTEKFMLPYKRTMEKYAANSVHPDDREKVIQMLSTYALRRNMTEGSHFQQCEYRRKMGDDAYGRALLIVQPARFENGSVKEVAIAFRYIEGEIE